MAQAAKKQILLSSDVKYFLTFGAGMAAFWLSGHATQFLPVIKSRPLAITAALVVTAGVYGLGMLLVAFLAFKKIGRPALIATVAAIILGIGSAQVIIRLAASHVQTKTDLGFLTFGLYLCYGIIYVIGLSLARRFAK